MRAGQRGDAVRDLQRRLTFAGYPPAAAEIGVYCVSTQAAVSGFQTSRGLRPTGDCDEVTWAAVIEAGWRLGDRLLKLTSPNMRGDDVSVLQAELCRLGFDAGRVDGIFGTRTATALLEFQRNCGVPGDGVLGPESVRALARVGRQSGTGPGVSVLRDAERLRELPPIIDCRIVIGQFGGLSSLTRSVARAVRSMGADVVLVDEPDAVAQAQAANRFRAHAYLGFEASFEPVSSVFYYRVPAFESTSGRALAERVADRTARFLDAAPHVTGIRLPVLRETRMPAIACRWGPVRHVVDDAYAISEAIAVALVDWLENVSSPSPLS